MPNMTRLLAQLALGLLALLCVLYALYMAFLMPPLVKYGDNGTRADGRPYCEQETSTVVNGVAAANFPDGKGGVDWAGLKAARAEMEYIARTSCLSKTAVDTPLLSLRMTVLLIIGAVSALLASRLKTA